MRYSHRALLALFMVAAFAGAASSQDVHSLKIACVLDAQHPVVIGARQMAEIAEKESGGRLKITVYPSSQLGGQREAIAALPADSDIEQIVRAYLSVEHRDHPGDGCPSAALLDEIGRCDDVVRRAYTDGLLGVIDVIAARLEPDDPSSARVRTLATFAGMVGTMQLARALTDRHLSDELLEQGVANALANLAGADE